MKSFASDFSETKISSVVLFFHLREWFGYFPQICLLVVFGKVPGQVWLSFVFCTRWVGCAFISFLLALGRRIITFMLSA